MKSGLQTEAMALQLRVKCRPAEEILSVDRYLCKKNEKITNAYSRLRPEG